MRKHKLALIVLIFLAMAQSLAFASVANASSNTDDWNEFRHDPMHNGYIEGNNPANSAVPLWNYTTGSSVASSPSVVNGYLFIGSKDYNIYCLNATSGQRIWNFPTAAEVESSPAVFGERVYVGSDDGWVYCLNITTGMPAWISLVGGEVQSSPTVVGDIVFVGSGKSGFFAFNASDGSLIWKFPLLYRVNSSPAVSDGIVYFAADDFHVYALNSSTGDLIWKQHTGSVVSSPTVYNGRIYIGSYDGYVCCLNASTGFKMWQYKTGDCVDASPSVAYGYIYVGSEDNNIYCLNASDGAKIWQASTGFWVRSSPAVMDGNVFVGSQDYRMYCFNASNGEEKWSIETGNNVDSSPSIAYGILYFGSSDYRVYAYTLTSENPPFRSIQSSIPVWTTIVFDSLGFVVATIVFYIILHFVYSNRQTKLNSNKLNSSTMLKTSWLSRHFDAVCILVILALSSIFFFNIGNGPLWAADEQTYSQWAYHMIKSGDYVTPYAFGGLAVWIGKPPLYMWLMSIGYQAFGVSNVVTRLWSPIFGALTLVLVYFLGKKLYNRVVGFVSSIVLATFTTFFLFARHAMTDVVFVFFIVASIYFFILSEQSHENSQYVILSGLFFGLALLTKQVEALLIPLTVFAYTVVKRRSIRFLLTKHFTAFWGIGLLILTPWIGYMFLSFGSNFWSWFVVYCGFMRTFSPLEGHAGGALFYFSYLANNERLWAILLPFATGLCAFNFVFKRSKADTLILAWIGVVFLVFTIAQTKLSWYILPAFPAFAIAISSFLFHIANKSKTYYEKKRTHTNLVVS
jgi:outer membrane protein assembly factor BamB